MRKKKPQTQHFTPKEVAMIQAQTIWANILLDDRVWTCRYCGAKTTVLSEFCSGCKIEDEAQGDPDWFVR